MKIICQNRKGFTIVEAVCSAVILGIGLVAMGAAFYSGFQFLDGARDMSAATLAAQQELESIRTMTYANIVAMGGSSTFTPAAATGLHSPAYTVNVDDFYGAADIRRVTVSVAWTGSGGRAMASRLVTLVTNSGINRK